MKKLLSACMAAVILIAGALSASADTISELEARQTDLEMRQAEYQAKLDEQNAAVAQQQGEVDAIVGQIQTVTEEIQVCYRKIGLIDAEISEKQVAIEAANAEIEANMEILRQRIKMIYIAGDVSSLEIILGAKDFNDFLDKLQLVKYVSDHDGELIKGLQTQLDEIADEKAELEADKEALKDEQTTLESKQKELNTLLEENKETLAKLQTSVENAKLRLELNEDALSGLSDEIQEYYRKQREALAAQQNPDAYIDDSAAANIDAGGGWVWPTPGCYYLSSRYHEARSYEYHDAIDIGACMGTPIYAANSGTIVSSNNDCTHSGSGGSWCSCGGGYGNYVWILHDNGYETIYGHMISTTVSTGQTVSAGQLIGYVGSTGWSTGAHLHFELRINGIRCNPQHLY